MNISSSESSVGFQRQQRYCMCYPGTASLEKRIEKVSSDAMSIDRLLRPRSLRPPVQPKLLWEQIRLSIQACNSQPSSKAKKPEIKLSSWEDSSPSRSTANNQNCSESSSRSLSPCPLSYSNPCITSVYASHLLRRHLLDNRYRRCLQGLKFFWWAISFYLLFKAQYRKGKQSQREELERTN